MEEKNIILERHKSNSYTVIHPETKRKYTWAGCKGSRVGSRAIPEEVYNYLADFTTCFSKGELIISPKNSEVEELKNELTDIEEYENNAMSKDDVIALLKGNMKKMEAELNKVTSATTKKFVMEVAKEIKLENSSKQKFLKEWTGSKLSIEDLFLAE